MLLGGGGGRKFVLRAHVLAHVSGGGSGGAGAGLGGTGGALLRLFLHGEPLVSEHASAEALVLQGGARSPARPLRQALPRGHGAVLARLEGAARAVFRELQARHPIQKEESYPGAEGGALYQIYGLDFMLDAAGGAFLLEVNRSPRIATGAMGDAHGLYTELLMDALQILYVTRAVHKTPGECGSWREIYQAGVYKGDVPA
jgi:hypothetical protein